MNAIDGGLIFAGLGVVVAGFAILLMLEAWLLIHNRPPITSYMRTAILKYPGLMISIGFIVIFVLGLLVAHFFWDTVCLNGSG